MNHYCFEKYESNHLGHIFRGCCTVQAMDAQQARELAQQKSGDHIRLFPVYVNPQDPYSR